MNRMAAVILIVVPSLALAKPSSSHLQDFNLNHCHGSACVQARGEIAFVSATGLQISASDVEIELASAPPAKTRKVQAFHCADFTFDLATQFLICDNEARSATSITVDSTLKIQKYPPQ